MGDKFHALAVAQKFSRVYVDRKNGIITGVSVITEGEVIGHNSWADKTTLEQIKRCAETYKGGLKVKADHGSGVFSVAGFLREFRIEESQLRANLHILQSESNREKLFDMAELIPDTFGLSVAFSGESQKIGGKKYLRCDEIFSVDIVSEPAANPSGLLARLRVFDATEKHKMTTDEIISTLEAITKSIESLNAKVEALEREKTEPNEKAEPKDVDPAREENAKAMSAMQASVIELSSKVVELTAKVADRSAERIELGRVIAKEINAAFKPRTELDAAPATTDTKPAEVSNTDKFLSKYSDNIKAGKSKTESLKLAMADEPTGYKDFVMSGKPLKVA